jgi:uncharacterized protein YjbI with pentapeptide repeats
MKSMLKKGLLAGAVIVGTGVLAYMVVETVRAKRTGFETKTLWDWLELLIIPLVLAGGAYFLNRSERIAERKIAIERQREAALQSYFDRMGEILFEKGLPIHLSTEARKLAGIQTLSVLRELDPNRKKIVLLFLKESNLIDHNNQIVSLKEADLNGVDLSRMDLSKTILKGTSLIGTTFVGTDLREADLSGANLRRANLSGADLRVAELSRADLSGANLSKAKLHNANLTGAILKGADLREAVLRIANLSGTDLSKAKLRGADQSGVVLREVNLWGENNTLEKDIRAATSIHS